MILFYIIVRQTFEVGCVNTFQFRFGYDPVRKEVILYGIGQKSLTGSRTT